jgi:prepilin-type processing-associated H-X9-DG protein
MKSFVYQALCLAILVAPSLVRGDTATPPGAVAPYVDELTVAVVHADLTGVAVAPLAKAITGLVPDAKEEIGRLQAEVTGHIDWFRRAGGSDIFITVALGGSGPLPRVLVVIPVAAGADDKAICASLNIPAGAGRRVGDALVICLSPPQNPSWEIHPSARPELAAAFQAAGNGTIQAALVPPAYTRRVIEELIPQLPKQIGGGPSTILTHGISWAAMTIDLSERPALRLVIQSQDAPAAETLAKKWAEVLRCASRQETVRSAVPRIDQVAALLTPKVERDRLVLALDDKTIVLGALVSLIQVPLQEARNAACRTQSMNNLKQLALAMHNYHATYQHFPAAASHSPDGKPLLSWRVYLLPFLDQKPLFDRFHLDEPWDSPHNRTLIPQMPAVFRPSASKAEKGKTNYLAPVGNGALYASPADEPQIKQITDGTSNTIMLVEVDDRHAVTWTQPDDLAFSPKDPLSGIGNAYESGFNAAFCDGSVRFLNRSIDRKTLTALFTRAGGEVIGAF